MPADSSTRASLHIRTPADEVILWGAITGRRGRRFFPFPGDADPGLILFTSLLSTAVIPFKNLVSSPSTALPILAGPAR